MQRDFMFTHHSYVWSHNTDLHTEGAVSLTQGENVSAARQKLCNLLEKSP